MLGRRTVWITLEVIGIVLVGLLTNVASDQLPKLVSAPWILYPALGVVLAGVVAVTLRRSADEASATFRPTRPSPRPPIRSPGRRQWAIVAATLALVVLVVAAVFVDSLTDLPKVEAWDDILYPQETLPLIYDMPERDELLESLWGPPEPLWTIPIRGGETDVIGGDSAIALLRFGTYLLGVDINTGTQRWPFIDLQDAPASCAVRENRIGCVTPASDGSDSTVFFLDTGSGQIVKKLKVPHQELSSIVVSGDRFIAVTDVPDRKGFAVGYTTEGDQVWTREGYKGMYVSASQGILVDSAYDATEVVFVSTADGREVLRSTSVTTKRDLVWNVFRGGIAIQNEDWTGTDIYNLRGEKMSSVAGWEPVAYQNRYDPSSSLPLLARLKDSSYPDEHTIAAANPETGHLLWRISRPDLSRRQMATVGDKLIVKLTDSDTPRDSTGRPISPLQELVSVYDCITGELLTSSINMTRNHPVEPYWIKSDGHKLVYTYVNDGPQSRYVMVGYDINSGGKTWELLLESQPGYPGGRIVAASSPEAVSLFG
jgi:hypothetical protein